MKRKKRVVTIGEGAMPEYHMDRHALVFVEVRKGVRHEVRVALSREWAGFACQVAKCALKAARVVRERHAERVRWAQEAIDEVGR